MTMTIERQVEIKSQRSRKCIPCLSQRVKAAIAATVNDQSVLELLDKIVDCRPGVDIELCGKTKKARSEYQEFASSCMRSKGSHSRAEAAENMKVCAAEWRARKR